MTPLLFLLFYPSAIFVVMSSLMVMAVRPAGESTASTLGVVVRSL